MRRIGSISGIGLMLCGCLAPAWGHPDANTIAEGRYDRSLGVLEVSIRVYPEMLERALVRESGRAIRLEESSSVDRWIERYLSRTIAIGRGMKGTPGERPTVTTIRWVGMELSAKEVWLYFEIPIEGELDGLTVRQSMFFELNPEQINTISIVAGDRRSTSVLTPATPTGRIRWKTVGDPKSPIPGRGLHF